MSAPTFVKGFIPSPDVIRNSLGPIAANTFGVVWMYNQMPGRECFADLTTIAANSGFGTTATRQALRVLEDKGWIERIERPGRTTVYRDKGLWSLAVVGEETAPATLSTGDPELSTTPTPGVAPTHEPQRQRLLTPTADVAPPTPDVGVPQRVALPNIQKKQTTKQTTKSKALSREDQPEEGPFRTREAQPPHGPPPRLASPARIDDGIPDSAIPPGLLDAFLDGCGLDSELSPTKQLQAARYWAYTLAKRRPAFTASEVKAAARAWHHKFPDRDPADILPPSPEQLAQWVGYRRAGKAMTGAVSRERASSGAGRERIGHNLVPYVER